MQNFINSFENTQLQTYYKPYLSAEHASLDLKFSRSFFKVIWPWGEISGRATGGFNKNLFGYIKKICATGGDKQEIGDEMKMDNIIVVSVEEKHHGQKIVMQERCPITDLCTQHMMEQSKLPKKTLSHMTTN